MLSVFAESRDVFHSPFQCLNSQLKHLKLPGRQTLKRIFKKIETGSRQKLSAQAQNVSLAIFVGKDLELAQTFWVSLK